MVAAQPFRNGGKENLRYSRVLSKAEKQKKKFGDKFGAPLLLGGGALDTPPLIAAMTLTHSR